MKKLLSEIKKEIKQNILPKYPFIKGYEIEKFEMEDYLYYSDCLGLYENDSVFTEKVIIKLNTELCKSEHLKEKLSLYTILLTTILHELAHAIQNYKDLEYNETQAEEFAYMYWDIGIVEDITKINKKNNHKFVMVE